VTQPRNPSKTRKISEAQHPRQQLEVSAKDLLKSGTIGDIGLRVALLEDNGMYNMP